MWCRRQQTACLGWRQHGHGLLLNQIPPLSTPALQPAGEWRLEGQPRPAPLMPGMEQPSEAELEGRVATAALAETKEKLAGFLEETQRVGVSLAAA